jgi:hypothetical protein
MGLMATYFCLSEDGALSFLPGIMRFKKAIVKERVLYQGIEENTKRRSLCKAN